jgi:hypothetical protein
MRSQTSGRTETKRPILRQYAGVLVAIVVLVVTGATVLTFSTGARHQLVLSFVRQPEKFTALYFSGPGLTQVSPSPDLVILTVSFTVDNHEGKATRRTEGSVEVADGSEATPTVAVNVPASAAWSAVEVNLQGRAEHLLLQSHPKAKAD